MTSRNTRRQLARSPQPSNSPSDPDSPQRVIIMGAAGRDFHNFNTVFRDNPRYQVVAFTSAQIPNISGRSYPPSLAGRLYPRGIPVFPEEQLPRLIQRHEVDQVYLSYSDLPHLEVMHKASLVLASGASFGLLGPRQTMLTASLPVVSVCAARTGCGKSPVSRRVLHWLQDRGYRVGVIRHPMPYGDLEKQTAQRFATREDLARAETTVEEREEYEPYIRMNATIYAGVDYARVLELAEKEADIILWDGGNNDFPFIRPDLHIVLVDPHRPGHELTYHPGETNLRMADLCIVGKADSAPAAQIKQVVRNARSLQRRLPIALVDFNLVVDRSDLIQGKRVVVVEDGPTLTHGEMSFGAGTLAARRNGASEVVDARPYAMGSIEDVYKQYAHLKGEVPAMGYSPQQLQDLEATLNAVDADVVVDATPVDLSRLINIRKPIVNVEYEARERGPELNEALERFVQAHLGPGQ